MNDLTPNPIKVTWHGTEIIYRETQNTWGFTLRGRERSAESLEKAKESIDAPPPADKVPFKRVSVYREERHCTWAVVEVTSIAEPRYGSTYCWIAGADKKREKVNARELYVITESNRDRVVAIGALVQQREKLSAQIEALTSKMTPFKLADNIE